jgi:putative tryptophan/tyrosine transport system substrate-binding protein
MRRREFITFLGGAAVAFPVAARAQQHAMRRIGVLLNLGPDYPESSVRVAALLKGLQELGWVDGRNLKIDYRWPAVDAASVHDGAAELVALAPNVVLASGNLPVATLQQITNAVPIIFVSVIDPVGAGLVESLARPGGNTTGFALFDYNISGKWLELLKQIAPQTKRAVVVRDPSSSAGIGQFAVIQAAASTYGIDLRISDPQDTSALERAMVAITEGSNGGLIVTASTPATRNRNQIVSLAAKHRLPAIYPAHNFVLSGGLISYGPGRVDQYRLAATYLDRVLKGEKPADLPVQVPTEYVLSVNLKTAKSLGITIPPTLLAIADGVIE